MSEGEGIPVLNNVRTPAISYGFVTNEQIKIEIADNSLNTYLSAKSSLRVAREKTIRGEVHG